MAAPESAKPKKHAERLAYADYAAERALADVPESNAHAREAARFLIILNGGAATAILALAGSAHQFGPDLAQACLAFVAGLVTGVLAMFSQALSLGDWIKHWHEIYKWKACLELPEHDETEEATRTRKSANRWKHTAHLFLVLSLALFSSGGYFSYRFVQQETVAAPDASGSNAGTTKR